VRASDEILTQIAAHYQRGGRRQPAPPFVAQQGAVTSHRETISPDHHRTAANIRRLLDILKLADVQVALDELQVIPIKLRRRPGAGRAPQPDVLDGPPPHGRGSARAASGGAGAARGARGGRAGASSRDRCGPER
jgi:hypothetical protein